MLRLLWARPPRKGRGIRENAHVNLKNYEPGRTLSHMLAAVNCIECECLASALAERRGIYRNAVFKWNVCAASGNRYHRKRSRSEVFEQLILLTRITVELTRHQNGHADRVLLK